MNLHWFDEVSGLKPEKTDAMMAEIGHMPPVPIILMILVGLGCVVAWYGGGLVARRRLDHRLARGTAGHGVLALTYDDGPGRRATPELLDLLARLDVRATFFVIGRSASEGTDLVDRIVGEGHTLGWHTERHRNQWKTDPLRGILDLAVNPVVATRQPDRCLLFRPPYGKMTLGTVLVARLRQWTIATWTHVSGDTHGSLPDPDDVVAAVEESGGGVVLMHDMDRTDPARGDFVLQTTEALVALARRKAWTIVAAPEEWRALA